MKKLMLALAAVALMGAAAGKWSKDMREEYVAKVTVALWERGVNEFAEPIAMCMADKREGLMSEADMKAIWAGKREPTDEERATAQGFVKDCACSIIKPAPEGCK
jgi:basic membrane lipoprotein Med (substrate-binding protein (PBP1-ABC) superfamily)